MYSFVFLKIIKVFGKEKTKKKKKKKKKKEKKKKKKKKRKCKISNEQNYWEYK